MYVESVEERVPPLAALAVAIVAVSTSAILVRASDAPSLVKGFYRVTFTILLLLPLAPRYGGAVRSLSARDLGAAVVTGVALAAHFAAWFESLEWTSVAASVTLVQTQPLFVGLGAAVLLDERLTRGMVAGLVVALCGSVVMSVGGLVDGGFGWVLAHPDLAARDVRAGLAGPGGADTVYGNALAVVGAVMAAGYVLAGRSLRQRVSLVPYVLVVYSACAVTLAVLVVGTHGPAGLVGYPPEEWALFLGMAVGPGLFGHTVINWALKYVESSVVSVSLLGEPVGSTLLALAVFAEVPTALTVLGGVVVLAGIYATTRARGAA